MTNLQRLQLEVKGITLSQEELSIYLMEADLNPHQEYNPQSSTSKRSIYCAALSILESIANNPSNMKNYKEDDMSVSDFAENIQSRIDQLERKIRTMKRDESDSNFFMLFNS
ncbi:hypothetical protein [Bacillus weihaiensis]|uniref:Uncharacterized protein n=1 Tax=Bacillus weihaiensis TaxID=1547283 RepID=A0A1L3MU21_9BACI|nr:hypothetical protein [Bacillus weihaiensis]APH05845.1 hypothetical protein A9C19_14495 [Bacillus weihaiensis]